MENIQDLPKAVRERIEALKEKTLLEGEEYEFLRARRDYLTEEERERLFGKKDEEVKPAKKTKQK